MRAVNIIYSMVPGATRTGQRFFKSRAAALDWIKLQGYTLVSLNEGTIATDADGQLIWLGDNDYSMPLTMA